MNPPATWKWTSAPSFDASQHLSDTDNATVCIRPGHYAGHQDRDGLLGLSSLSCFIIRAYALKMPRLHRQVTAFFFWGALVATWFWPGLGLDSGLTPGSFLETFQTNAGSGPSRDIPDQAGTSGLLQSFAPQPVSRQLPQAMAASFASAAGPDSINAYVTNINTSSVSVIDTGTNTAIATIPVGLAPRGVAISPDWTRLYVANLSSRTVSVIDTATNTVIETLTTLGFPRGVAITPDGSQVYVGDEGLSTVLVIDPKTNTFVDSISVGRLPYGLAVTPDGTRAFVSNFASDTVSVIDTTTNSVIATIPVGALPYGVAIAPLNELSHPGTRVYVVNFGSDSVSVLDANTNALVATIGVGLLPCMDSDYP